MVKEFFVSEKKLSDVIDFVLEDIGPGEQDLTIVKPKKPKTRDNRGREPISDIDDIRNRVKGMTPQDLQELAIATLVGRVEQGDVGAAKELISFTEDTFVNANDDLEGMTPSELMQEVEKLRADLQLLINKEVVGV